MKKNLFLSLLFLASAPLCATNNSDQPDAGFVNAAFFGICNTKADLAIYLAAPLLGLAINSIKKCKAVYAEKEAAFRLKKERQEAALLLLNADKKISKLSKEDEAAVQKATQSIEEPEKYSLKAQAQFFVSQLVTIATDPATAITEQPFFTAMSFLFLYRTANALDASFIENKEEKKDLKFKHFMHADQQNQYRLLPEWIQETQHKALTAETINTLITTKLKPKINPTDKFSSVWQSIAAQFATCAQIDKQKVPYFCFESSPGVGKTYFAKELAKELDYHCEIIECGLIDHTSGNANDFFKGFLRTYQGAAPGKIIEALKKSTGKKGCIIVLDEIDKVSAPDQFLALLDPEQNKTFIDNFIGHPIDLSNVIFVATANDITKIKSEALLSRLQLIKIESYTPEQKKAFAHKQIKENEQLAHLKNVTDAENMIDSLIDSHDNIAGGVRKVMQMLNSIQKYSIYFAKYDQPKNNRDAILEAVKKETTVLV